MSQTWCFMAVVGDKTAAVEFFGEDMGAALADEDTSLLEYIDAPDNPAGWGAAGPIDDDRLEALAAYTGWHFTIAPEGHTPTQWRAWLQTFIEGPMWPY